MYRTIIEVLPDNIMPSNNGEQRILVPFLVAYELHIITFCVAPLFQPPSEYIVEPPYILWKGSPFIEKRDTVILYVDYFYKKNYHDFLLQKIGEDINDILPSSSEETKRKRIDIILKHLINGLFAYDNGLYKEAVLNFGTIIEAILNSNLQNKKLNDLINSLLEGHVLFEFKDDMHIVRETRNKVHANKLSDVEDIDNNEAYICRSIIDKILSSILRHKIA